jgi:hypothetical protein
MSTLVADDLVRAFRQRLWRRFGHEEDAEEEGGAAAAAAAAEAPAALTPVILLFFVFFRSLLFRRVSRQADEKEGRVLG